MTTGISANYKFLLVGEIFGGCDLEFKDEDDSITTVNVLTEPVAFSRRPNQRIIESTTQSTQAILIFVNKHVSESLVKIISFFYNIFYIALESCAANKQRPVGVLLDAQQWPQSSIDQMLAHFPDIKVFPFEDLKDAVIPLCEDIKLGRGVSFVRPHKTEVVSPRFERLDLLQKKQQQRRQQKGSFFHKWWRSIS